MTVVFGLLLVLPAVAAVGVAALRSPTRTVLPVYAALVPFGSGIALPIPLPSPFDTVTTLAGLAASGALVLHIILVGGTRRLHPSLSAWLMFVGVSGLTFAWSIDRGDTVERFLILISLVALYVVALLAPVGREEVERLKDGIIIGATLACGYGFFLLLTGNLPEEKAGLPRFATAGGVGDASDPNITAAVLVLPLVLAISRVFRSRRPIVRAAHGAAALLIATGLLLTASRGGMLAASLAVFVLVLHERRRALIVVVTLLLVTIVGLVGYALAPEQIERLDKPGSSGRTSIWMVGLIACERWCLTGSGLNTFEEVHTETLLSTAEATGFRLGEPPHNMWLGVAIEVGVVGVALLAVALVLTALPLRRLSLTRRGPPLAALVGLLVANFFLANLHFKYFWLVLLYVAYEAQSESDVPKTDDHAASAVARALEPV